MSTPTNPNRLMVYAPYIVYAVSIFLVGVPFLVFAFAGWGGEPNGCLLNEAGVVDPSLQDNCFCERVDVNAVINGEPGVRQWANTLSNLYALFTSLVVAIGISRDRKANTGRTAKNLITSDNLLADILVFAVFFLGFGSMWYHASITEWGGRFDGMSMYAFVSYMICYTLFRLVPSWWLFLVCYVSLVALFTALHNTVASVILIAINVGIYVVLELIVTYKRLCLIAKDNWNFPDKWYLALLWWLGALACFGLAVVFWVMGVAGKNTCNPTSAWQWHGMWHVFAGFMAVFIYYYWRRVRPIHAVN